jgi:elongator complex protein 3
MKKNSRTISGVTPVAVMTAPAGCPGRCVYCPTYTLTPQSYTPESPAVIRARGSDYDARRQTQRRLQTLAEMGHPTDKVELIIMGGTFLATPVDYQYQFVKDCYDALNGTDSTSLAEAQEINETAARRCVGLCIETRPDVCGEAEVQRMLEYGATRVESGVQMLDDDIYQRIHRGHTVADVIQSTRLLKRYGMKVYYHWMPGLPGSNPEHDLALSRELFENPDFRPDGLKLYPTMVVAGTELEEWYQKGDYQPYPDEVMLGLIASIKSLVPGYVRISRVLRDIPSRYIVAGLRDSVREKIKEIMAERGDDCRCIRCREYGHRQIIGWEIGEPGLKRLDYEASGGREILLSFEDAQQPEKGLLRLRIEPEPPLRLGNGRLALVRELHIFGPELALGERSGQAAQHRGLGRTLLAEAENIAATEFGIDLMAVLSGVGARGYYADSGYHLEAGYMIKSLSNNHQPGIIVPSP